MSGCSSEDRQPAIGRPVEPAHLEVEVAEAVGRVVADGREEIGREDPFERLQLRRAVRLLRAASWRRRRRRDGKRPAPREGVRRAPRAAFRATEMMKPCLAVDEPGGLLVGDAVEGLQGPLPRAASAETVRSRRTLPSPRSKPAASARAGPAVVRDLVSLVVLGLHRRAPAKTETQKSRGIRLSCHLVALVIAFLPALKRGGRLIPV